MLNQTRVDGLLHYMDEIGLCQMVIRNPVLIRYMLGYTPRGNDRATILYVSKTNGVKLIVNELTVFPKDLGVELVLHGDQDDVCALIAQHTLHDQPLGFDGEYPAKWLLPLRQHNAASDYVLADRALNLQRAHKDAEEMELLREASRMNDRVMAKARTEREVSRQLSALFKEEGADSPGWAIVAFGENAAHVHHTPGDRALKAGDAILIDMGASRGGYHSDMTRTFFCKTADPKYAAIHNTVREANELAELLLRPGIELWELDKAARDHISEAGYGEYFSHSFGHSLGIDIHEAPNASPKEQKEMPVGAVISAEPGIYIPGKFGVRIEDVLILKEGGCEDITRSPRNLIIL